MMKGDLSGGWGGAGRERGVWGVVGVRERGAG